MEPEAGKLDDALLGKVNDVVLSLDALGLTRQIAADMPFQKFVDNFEPPLREGAKQYWRALKRLAAQGKPSRQVHDALEEYGLMRFEKLLVGLGLGDIKAYPPKSDHDDLNEAEILWLKQIVDAAGLDYGDDSRFVCMAQALMDAHYDEILQVRAKAWDPKLAQVLDQCSGLAHFERFKACGLSWEVLMRVELGEALDVMRMGSPELGALVRAVFALVRA